MKIKIVYLIVMIVAITAVNMPILERFTITNEKSGHVVFQDRVDRYKEFYISFLHSVNKTPVNEYYSISEGKLILKKATFYSYGAGMPEIGENGSDEPRIVNGQIQLENIDKEFEKFTYFAGTYANHSLNIDKTQILFSQFVKPQTPVTFEVKKISIITLLMSYLILK
jgi:hypothetical protein